MPKVLIVENAFDPWTELVAHQGQLAPGSFGACCPFVGNMRDFNQGDDVQAMELEHYPAMTQRQLEQIADAAMQQWPVIDVLIVHRVGHILPGDNIVLCAVWSAHRDASFKACRYLIEELKARAPFWKKETLNDGDRWVDA